MSLQHSEAPRARATRLGLSRYSLAGALVATLLIAAGALALALGGSRGGHGLPSRSRGAHSSAHAAAPSGAALADATKLKADAAVTRVRAARKRAAPGVAVAGTSDGAVATPTVTEAPDPEEAKSFPAPPSVRHPAAAAPRAAAAEVVAPGAPSNAEVRRELGRMHAIERAAQRQEQAVTTTVPGGDSVGGNGQIPIPAAAPEIVQRVIAGANAITDFPYVFGGGHGSFVDNAYDCSGSVSYALAAGGLLSAPETSGALESWGAPGPGKWITVYANAGHTYMYVNTGGRWMRYDTVGRSGVYASRWQPQIRSNAGFVARHWPGL